MASMSPEGRKKVLKVLYKSMQHPLAEAYFNEPVDAEGLGIPEYRRVVAMPMDLGTVVKKVQMDEYSNPADAMEDVRLVWRNCHSFNEPGSEVYKACDELAGFVDQRWLQAGLPIPPQKLHDSSQALSSSGGALNGLQLSLDGDVGGIFGNGNSGMPAGFVPSNPSPSLMTAPQESINGTQVPPLAKRSPRGKPRGDKGAAARAKAAAKPCPLQKCLQAMEAFTQLPPAAPFLQQGKEGAPVGLSTILQRLATGPTQGWATVPYTSPSAVAADVLGLFSHHRSLANGKEDPIPIMLNAAEAAFKAQWQQAGLPLLGDAPDSNKLGISVPQCISTGSAGRNPKRQRFLKELHQNDTPSGGGGSNGGDRGNGGGNDSGGGGGGTGVTVEEAELRLMDNIDLEAQLGDLGEYDGDLMVDLHIPDVTVQQLPPPQQQQQAGEQQQHHVVDSQAEAARSVHQGTAAPASMSRLQSQSQGAIMRQRPGLSPSPRSPGPMYPQRIQDSQRRSSTGHLGSYEAREMSSMLSPTLSDTTNAPASAVRCEVCSTAKKGKCGQPGAVIGCLNWPPAGSIRPTSLAYDDNRFVAPNAAAAAPPTTADMARARSATGPPTGPGKCEDEFMLKLSQMAKPGVEPLSRAAPGGSHSAPVAGSLDPLIQRAQQLKAFNRSLQAKQHQVEKVYRQLLLERQRVSDARIHAPRLAAEAEMLVRQWAALAKQVDGPGATSPGVTGPGTLLSPTLVHSAGKAQGVALQQRARGQQRLSLQNCGWPQELPLLQQAGGLQQAQEQQREEAQSHGIPLSAGGGSVAPSPTVAHQNPQQQLPVASLQQQYQQARGELRRPLTEPEAAAYRHRLAEHNRSLGLAAQRQLARGLEQQQRQPPQLHRSTSVTSPAQIHTLLHHHHQQQQAGVHPQHHQRRQQAGVHSQHQQGGAAQGVQVGVAVPYGLGEGPHPGSTAAVAALLGTQLPVSDCQTASSGQMLAGTSPALTPHHQTAEQHRERQQETFQAHLAAHQAQEQQRARSLSIHPGGGTHPGAEAPSRQQANSQAWQMQQGSQMQPQQQQAGSQQQLQQQARALQLQQQVSFPQPGMSKATIQQQTSQQQLQLQANFRNYHTQQQQQQWEQQKPLARGRSQQWQEGQAAVPFSQAALSPESASPIPYVTQQQALLSLKQQQTWAREFKLQQQQLRGVPSVRDVDGPFSQIMAPLQQQQAGGRQQPPIGPTMQPFVGAAPSHTTPPQQGKQQQQEDRLQRAPGSPNSSSKVVTKHGITPQQQAALAAHIQQGRILAANLRLSEADTNTFLRISPSAQKAFANHLRTSCMRQQPEGNAAPPTVQPQSVDGISPIPQLPLVSAMALPRAAASNRVESPPWQLPLPKQQARDLHRKQLQQQPIAHGGAGPGTPVPSDALENAMWHPRPNDHLGQALPLRSTPITPKAVGGTHSRAGSAPAMQTHSTPLSSDIGKEGEQTAATHPPYPQLTSTTAWPWLEAEPTSAAHLSSSRAQEELPPMAATLEQLQPLQSLQPHPAIPQPVLPPSDTATPNSHPQHHHHPHQEQAGAEQLQAVDSDDTRPGSAAVEACADSNVETAEVTGATIPAQCHSPAATSAPIGDSQTAMPSAIVEQPVPVSDGAALTQKLALTDPITQPPPDKAADVKAADVVCMQPSVASLAMFPGSAVKSAT